MTEQKTIENALDFEVLRRAIEDLNAGGRGPGCPL